MAAQFTVGDAANVKAFPSATGLARNAPDARQDVNVHRPAAARPCRQKRAEVANEGSVANT